MTARYSYERDGAAIYARSFGTIRAEADLSGLSPEEARDCRAGDPRLRHDRDHPTTCGSAAVSHRRRGAHCSPASPILCDAQMVAHGITRSRLPAGNDVVCTLGEPDVPAMAARLGTTRSAAALDLWGDRLAGAVVAIGNAPTALFRLLELLDAGAPLPAAIIGMPVGFVGAAEAKEALAADGRVPFLIVRGRKGGSAMAVAAVNALASEAE